MVGAAGGGGGTRAPWRAAAKAAIQTSELPPSTILISLFLYSFAYQLDVIAQTVQHTRICDRHCGVICFFLQAIEPCNHLAGVVPAGAGICHLAFQEAQ